MDPTTIWLREEPPGSRVFFPNTNNSGFMLSDDVGILVTHLIAMGSPTTQSSAQPSTSRVVSHTQSSASGLTSPTNSAGSTIHNQPVPGRKRSSISVKVVQAGFKRLISGRPEFTPQNQTFVDLTEATANVNYVTSAVQRRWGADYVMVTSDGLKIDDSSGTQGMYHTVLHLDSFCSYNNHMPMMRAISPYNYIRCTASNVFVVEVF